MSEYDCRSHFCGISLHASVLSLRSLAAVTEAEDGRRTTQLMAPRMLLNMSYAQSHCTNQTQEEIWIDYRFLKRQVLYFSHVV